mgnify:CR=1 FL=1
MEEELCKLKHFRRKIEEQLDHPYDILDNIQENMTEQLEKVQEPYTSVTGWCSGRFIIWLHV